MQTLVGFKEPRLIMAFGEFQLWIAEAKCSYLSDAIGHSYENCMSNAVEEYKWKAATRQMN